MKEYFRAMDLLECGDEDGYSEIRDECAAEAWEDHGESELWGAVFGIVGGVPDGELDYLRAAREDSEKVELLCAEFEIACKSRGWIEFEFTQTQSAWNMHGAPDFRAAVIEFAGRLGELIREEFLECVLDGARGIYLPQDWAQWHAGSDECRQVLDAELYVLRDGPETERGDYWEAWDTVTLSDYWSRRRFELGEGGDVFWWSDEGAMILHYTLANCPSH